MRTHVYQIIIRSHSVLQVKGEYLACWNSLAAWELSVSHLNNFRRNKGADENTKRGHP